VREQNASIISQLKILADAYGSTNDKWRALTYEKAIKQIERVKEPITDRKQVSWRTGKEIAKMCAQVLALPGIGRALADKICEIMATGTLRKATAMAGDERVQALQTFTNVWGVGPTTARQWYDAGECVCVRAHTHFAQGTVHSTMYARVSHSHDNKRLD
jgi:DNA polymerase/3'-5' exonuclease PolX